jgi:cholesterol oxidase
VEGEILLLRFGAMFLRSIWPFYGGMLNELGRFPAPPAPAEASDALDVVSAPDHVAPAQGVAALDSTMRPSDPDLVLVCDRSGRWHPHRDVPDACSRLIRFEGGGKGPVMLASGFAMSATSFLAPTVRPNLTEALLEAGYDVWLFDYRAGIDLPSAATQFTVDDIARTDWPQAVGQVLDVTGARTVQVFAHCVGSVSLLMALLDPGNGMQGRVRSAVCAQFTLHPMTSRLKVFESKHHLGALLEAAGQKVLRPDTERTVRNIALDIALSAVPHPHHEGCELPVCRWINAVFGMTHRHAQLDDATHRALPGMFGDANIHCLTHLGLMMQRARAVDAQGRDRYLQHPELLRGVPIHILAGEDNYIFHPEGNERTLRWLQEHNDPDDYTLTMLPGYAHLDALVGRDAPRQVFPDIIEHLDRHR